MLAKTSPKLFKSCSFGLVTTALLPSKNSDEMNSNARRVAIVMMIKYCYSSSIKNVATLNNIRKRILLTYKLCLYVRMVHAMEVYSMSIATGDKKISLRVGGKDLALNEDSKSFLPMKNPEDIPSNLIVEYSNPFHSGESGNSIVIYNNIDGGPSLMRFMNHEREGISIGVDVHTTGNILSTSGLYYYNNKMINSCPSIWLISHRDDGIYIGDTRVTDNDGNWILK